MINITEGKIYLGAKNILATSDHENLNSLAEEGLIEKRETGRGGTYYYVESAMDGMRFGVFISLREKRIDWLRLQWLDSPIKGWDDVSEEALRDEYRLLINFLKNSVGRRPNNKSNGNRTWRFKWAQLKLSYDVRARQVDIFMVTRWGDKQKSLI